MNVSAQNQFKTELNSQANIREYLMTFTTKLIISTANSIKLQASSLAQLTQATNELTRTTLVRTITLMSNFYFIRLLHWIDVINYHWLYNQCQQEFPVKMFKVQW